MNDDRRVFELLEHDLVAIGVDTPNVEGAEFPAPLAIGQCIAASIDSDVGSAVEARVGGIRAGADVPWAVRVRSVGDAAKSGRPRADAGRL